MTPEKDKVICRTCEWRGRQSEMLQAPSPFDAEDALLGCPQCKEVNCLYPACDEPECWQVVCCGTPSHDGYRATCSKHRQKERPDA